MTLVAYDTNTITTTGSEDTIKSVTAVGEFALAIDFSAMASGDSVVLKTYKIVRTSGTKRLLFPPVQLSGAPTDATGAALLSQWIPNDISDANSIQFTITRITGTDRAYPWKVYQRTDQADMTKLLGTAVATPATAGVIDANVKNVNNVAATSVTTVNANLGTTQPVNFTGTGASALAKSDMVDVAGAAVSTTTAQIGTNVVQISGDSVAADNLEAYSDGTTPQPVNVTHLSGDSTAADNAESFFDGTGYAGTNNVIPTVTLVNGLAANTITATSIQDAALTLAKFASDATDDTALVDAIWNEATAGHATAGTTGKALTDAATGASPSAIADAVWDEDATGHQTQGTFGQAIGDPVADTDTIWAKTNNLPSDPADESLLETAITAAQTAILAKLPSALVSGRIDASVGAMATDVLTATALATSAVNEIVDAILAGLASTTGTAAAGAAGTITLAASAVATTDYYINQWVWIRSGTGLGQARRIKSYTSGRVATVDGNWATNPSTDSVYYILPSGRVDLGTILGTSINALISGRVDASVGAYQSGLTPLQPTVAARTLDVTATGEAGIDLANVGSPTTVLNLSGLTIKTATDVEADTQDLQSRTPAALVGGKMDSNIGSVGGSTSVMAAFLAALGVQTIGAVTTTALGATSFSTNVSSTDNAWRYHAIMFTSGVLNKHTRTIASYTNTNGLITVDDAFPSAPANGDTFVIL